MAIAAAEGEVYQVVLQGRQEGQEVMNVIHFQTPTGSSDVELHLLRALIICLLSNLRPAMNSYYKFERAIGKRVSPTLGPPIEMLPQEGEVVQGQSAGDGLPTFVSGLVSIRGERGGREGLGRMFLPGVPEASTSGSFIVEESPYWNAILAYVTCVIAEFMKAVGPGSANQWNIGVMSRKIGGEKPPYNAAGFSRAIALTPRLLLATTRSRKVGRGS